MSDVHSDSCDVCSDSCDAGTKDGEDKAVDMSSKEPKLVEEILGSMPVNLSSWSIGSFEVDDSEQYDKLTQKYSDLSPAKELDSDKQLTQKHTDISEEQSTPEELFDDATLVPSDVVFAQEGSTDVQSTNDLLSTPEEQDKKCSHDELNPEQLTPDQKTDNPDDVVSTPDKSTDKGDDVLSALDQSTDKPEDVVSTPDQSTFNSRSVNRQKL